MIARIALYLLCSLLAYAPAIAQSPARLQLGAGAPAPLQVRDRASTWVTLGTIDSTTHTATWTGTVNNLTLNSTTMKCEAAATHGFVGDGLTDNSVKMSTWFTGLSGADGCLSFPAGTFVFNSAVALTPSNTQDITIVGAGGSTELRNAGAHDFLSITYPDYTTGGFKPDSGVVTLKEFRLTTDQIGARRGIFLHGGAFTGVTNNKSLISHINFDGTAAGNFWKQAIYLENVYLLDIEHSEFQSQCTGGATCADDAITIDGPASDRRSISIWINANHIAGGKTGIKATGHFEGINILQNHINNVDVGVSCDAITTTPMCNVIGNHINAHTQDVFIDNVNSFDVSHNLLFQGQTSDMPANSPMVKITNTTRGRIAFNSFNGAAASGDIPNGIKLENVQNVTGGGNEFDNVDDNHSFDGLTSNVRMYGSTSNGLGGTPYVDSGADNSVLYSSLVAPTGDLAQYSNGTLDWAMDRPAGFAANLFSRTNGISRWQVQMANATAEAGANAGSNFAIVRYADAGTLIDVPFSINRASGDVTLTKSLLAPVIRDTSAIPTVSACGTSPTVSTGSHNSAGSFTTGTGTPAACTITFSGGGWVNNAWCTVVAVNAAAVATTVRVSASSNTAFTVTMGASAPSAQYNYICQGN